MHGLAMFGLLCALSIYHPKSHLRHFPRSSKFDSNLHVSSYLLTLEHVIWPLLLYFKLLGAHLYYKSSMVNYCPANKLKSEYSMYHIFYVYFIRYIYITIFLIRKNQITTGMHELLPENVRFSYHNCYL